MAATLVNNNFGDAYGVGVAPNGEVWKLRGRLNVLAPDGRLLVRTVAGSRTQPLVLLDLTTGARRVLRVATTGRGTRPKAAAFTPLYWSQDNSAIHIDIGSPPQRRQPYSAVVDTRTGVVTKLGPGVPAGFLSPDEAVTVRLDGPRGTRLTEATITNLDTQTATSLRLRPTRPLDLGGESALANVSPDGRTLLVMTGGRGTALVRLFSMADGHELPPRTVTSWEGFGCGVTWLDNDPVLPIHPSDDTAGSVQVTAKGNRPLVELPHRLQGRCLQWAADALPGGYDTTLLDTFNQRWTTWYWWLAFPVVLLPTAAIAIGAVRRRTRRRPISP